MPSIRGGTVFEDMILYSGILVTELETSHRSDKEAINKNALNVLYGADIEPDKDNLIFIESNTVDEIKSNLRRVIKKYKIMPNNSCVLIPTKKHEFGTIEINKYLQEFYNKESPVICSSENYQFKIGDKMINKKNNYEMDIYNGSILTITNCKYKKYVQDDNGTAYIEHYDNGELIKRQRHKENKERYRKNQLFDKEFDCIYHKEETDLVNGRHIKFSIDQMLKLELAYAITVHSAQGKGYETVVIILHSSMYNELLTRRLLYTAITRAKKRCIILGDQRALELCKKEDKKRITNLFQSRRTTYDKLSYIIGNIHEYRNDSVIQQIINELDLDCKIIEQDFINSGKTYFPLVKKLMSDNTYIDRLFKRIEECKPNPGLQPRPGLAVAGMFSWDTEWPDLVDDIWEEF